ncbi:hypothetical protein [Bacillus taeanensis]|uniref:Uncharacterized protein n=1 Tax=Bacillus taeanensis TaxID=273032 RepID=A0A366Y418_9BACI|nr:hypothetical protein [Bacillus taeanensis]RBW70931.1 hypothetical protein DS031_02740 [Bacillus taeanensis]
MNSKIQAFYSKVKQAVEETAHKVKDKAGVYKQRETVTIAEVSEMIQHHSESRVKKRTMLGLTYRFYKLTLENITFEMETKGAFNEELLCLSIYTEDAILLTYRSYENKRNKHEPISANHLAAVVKRNDH